MKMKALASLSRTGYHVSTTQWAAHDKERAENRKMKKAGKQINREKCKSRLTSLQFLKIILLVAVVFFGEPIYFVKKKSQQNLQCWSKKYIKPKLGNPKPFCNILKTSMFLEFFMKT